MPPEPTLPPNTTPPEPRMRPPEPTFVVPPVAYVPPVLELARPPELAPPTPPAPDTPSGLRVDSSDAFPPQSVAPTLAAANASSAVRPRRLPGIGRSTAASAAELAGPTNGHDDSF